MKYGTIYADPPWMERGGRQDQAGSGSPLPAHEYKRHHGARRPEHRGGGLSPVSLGDEQLPP